MNVWLFHSFSTSPTDRTIQSASVSSWISIENFACCTQFARVFNSLGTVALRILFAINMGITRFTIYANSISKYDIYVCLTRSILLSSRTELEFAYMKKYLGILWVCAEGGRRREGAWEFILPQMTREKEKEWARNEEKAAGRQTDYAAVHQRRPRATSMPTRTTTSTPVRMQFKVQGDKQRREGQ